MLIQGRNSARNLGQDVANSGLRVRVLSKLLQISSEFKEHDADIPTKVTSKSLKADIQLFGVA